MAFAAVQPSAAQIQCGGENQRVCGPGDPQYSVWYAQSAPNPNHIFFPVFTDNSCDLALGPKDGVCNGFLGASKVDGVPEGGIRHIQQLHQYLGAPSNQWINFAMQQQNGIQSDQAINWTTVFGTHNSFSNYQDGGFSPLNADQYYSISDQLDAGARYIRIDPITYKVLYDGGTDSELRVCHESSDPAAECNITSYGRLFAYSLAEVRTWLLSHPSEVLVLRLNRVQSSDESAIDMAIAQELESSGIPVLLPATGGLGSSPTAWNPKSSGWPTLRQMRTMGVRIIIFSDSGTPDYAFAWSDQTSIDPRDTSSYVLYDGYSDVAGFNPLQCENAVDPSNTEIPAIDVRSRAFDQWAYIGEDRSLSNFLGSCSPGCGLLNPNAVALATGCGFSMINVDFLLAGFATTSLGAFSDPDTRREAAIWSWDQGDLGNNGTAFMKPNGRWSSMPPSTSLPFACAVGASNPGNPQNPVHYSWAITSTSDQWAAGPERCAQIPASAGGPGIFWAPQSALENIALHTAAAGENVWINYGAAGLFLEAGSPESTIVTGANSFEVNVTTDGDPTALKNLHYQFTGGPGGKLTVAPGAASTQLFTSYTVNSLKKTITPTLAEGVVNSNNQIALQPGVYTQSFTVQENLPNSDYSYNTYTVTVNVARNTVHVNLNCQPPGATVIVDNASYQAPLQFEWIIGSHHVVTFPSPQPAPGQPGTQLLFSKWDDGIMGNTRNIAVGNEDEQFTGLFTQQFFVTAAASPANGGTVTGQGWYNPGASAILTATAAGGYEFTGFNGQTSPLPTLTVQVNGPRTETADFTAASPQLTATAQIESDSDTSTVVLGVGVTNYGPGTAAGIEIDSVTFAVQSPGTGTVSLANPLPISVGTLASAATSPNIQLTLNWPEPASRLQINIHFTANQGAWQGTQTLYLFR